MKLKPCPFCGGEAGLIVQSDDEAYLCGAGDYCFIYVKCLKCKMITAKSHCHRDDSSSYRMHQEEKWNTRTQEEGSE